MRDLLRSFAATGGIQIANLMTGVLAARLLLPEGRGELALVMLWPGIIVAIGFFSIDQAVVYLTASRRSDASRILSSAWLYATAAGAITLALGLVLLPLLAGDTGTGTAGLSKFYLLFLIPLHFYGVPALAYLQGLLRLDQWNIVRVVQPYLYLAGILVALVLEEATVRGFVYATLSAGALSLGLTLVMIFRKMDSMSGPSKAHLREMAVYSAKVHFGSLIQIANGRMSHILIVAYLALDEFGIFVAVGGLASAIGLISATMSNVAFPKIANQATASGKGIVLGRYLRLFLVLSLGAAALIMLFGGWLIGLLFGAAFLDGTTILSLLAVLAVVQGAAAIVAMGLKATGTVMPVNVAELVSLFIGVPAMLVLIQTLGLIGVPLALIVAQCASLVPLLLASRRAFKVKPITLFIPTSEDWAFAKTQCRALLAALRRPPA